MYTSATISSIDANAVTTDPNFSDDTSPYGTTVWATSVAKYELPSDSPCVDAGTTDADLTDDIYDTARPQNVVNDIGAFEFSGAATAPTYSSSEVGLSSTTVHILTLSKVISSPGADYTAGFTINTGTISSAVRGTNQATIEFTVDTAETEGGSPTIAYNAGVGDIQSQDGTPVVLATFTAQNSTNNVNAAAPTIVSALASPAADTIVATFSEALTEASSNFLSGFSITINAAGVTISSGDIEPDPTMLRFMFTPLVTQGDTVLISYNDTLGDITDNHATNKTDLASFTDQAVTNNVIDGASAMVLSARLRLQPGM